MSLLSPRFFRSFPLLFAMGGGLLGPSGCDARPAQEAVRFPHAVLTPAPTSALNTPGLIGSDGKPFKWAGLAGRWVWLYFGFTHCPDVCPTALEALSAEYRLLKTPRSVATVFVSVDPGRDTPAKLATFTHFYHPDFVGVTGARSAIDALTHAVGAAYAIDPPPRAPNGVLPSPRAPNGVLPSPPNSQDYTVSHTNLIFVLDPQGRYVATYATGANAGDLAKDFNASILETQENTP